MPDKAINLPAKSSFWIRHRLKLVIGLLLLQMMFLLGLTASSYAVLWYGQEIRIQTAPIDPRDPLYGDHVVLNYQISELKSSLWKESGKLPNPGETVYVLLKRISPDADGIYEAAGVYARKPVTTQAEAVLKARMAYSYDYDNIFHLEYGLEAYYVPENTGKALEEKAHAGVMLATVKVAPWGRAVLTGLESGKK
jgi:uncharacterized membrane-anchored protein